MHTQYIYASDESVAIEKLRQHVAAISDSRSEVGQYSVLRVRRTFWQRITNTDPKWKIDYFLEEPVQETTLGCSTSAELYSADLDSDASNTTQSLEHARGLPEQAPRLDAEPLQNNAKLDNSPDKVLQNFDTLADSSVSCEPEQSLGEVGATQTLLIEHLGSSETLQQIANEKSLPTVDEERPDLSPRDDIETAELNIESTILEPEQTTLDEVVELSQSVELTEPFQSTDEMANAEATPAAEALDHNVLPQDDIETAELDIEATILEPEQTTIDEVVESSPSVELTEPFKPTDEMAYAETTPADDAIDHNVLLQDDIETAELDIEATILEPEQITIDEIVETSPSVELTEPFQPIDEMANAEATPAADAIDHNVLPQDDIETAELDIEATILEPEQITIDEVVEASPSVELTAPIETIDENTQSEIVELGNANSFLSTELKHAVETSEIQSYSSREEIPSHRLSETMNPPEVLGVPGATRQLPQPFVEHRDIYEALQTTLHVGINQKMPPLRRTSLSANDEHSTRTHQDAISIEKNIVNESPEDSKKNVLGIAVRSDLVDAVFRSFDPKTTESKVHKLDK